MADQSYQLFDYELRSRGLVARFLQDDVPADSYLNLDGWEARQENSLGSRLGPMMITTNGTNNTPLTDLNVHTLRRLKGIAGNTWRYGGGGANLYRRTGDTNGAYTQINTSSLSGSRFSAEIYRPNLSSTPFLFIADNAAMLKDNGTGNAQNWGGLPPLIPLNASFTSLVPATIVAGNQVVVGSFTTVNVGAFANANRVNTTMGTPSVAGGSVQTITPASMANIVPNMFLFVDTGGLHPEAVLVISITTTTFTAAFTFAHIGAATVVNGFVSGTVAANTTAQIQTAIAAGTLTTVGAVLAGDDDFISLYIKMDNPFNVQQIQVQFDVSDGTFTKSYYSKIVAPDSLQPVVSGAITGGAGIVRRVFDRAGGAVPTRILGERFVPVLPGDDPSGEDLQPLPLATGLSQWTQIQIRRGDFLKVGQAGQVGFDWSLVTKGQVTIQTISTAGVTFGLDDWFQFGGSGLDSLGGVAYDWRYTYYNQNTGYETNPSITLDSSLWLLPQRQPVLLRWTLPTDPQFTHVRLYRRGGSLPTGWQLVTAVAVGSASGFIDTYSDESISTTPSLQIDNDPPVTTALASTARGTLGTAVTPGSTQSVHVSAPPASVPVGTLMIVGEGDNQEEVYIQGSSFVGGFHVDAFFQRAHAATEVAEFSTKPNTPMNLMAIAFDRAWLAGDPTNPHMLYYSKKFNAESFPPQNALEIGDPGDPIMGIVEFRSLLYVFTFSKIYSVFAPGGATPQVYSTAETTYGLVANFGFCVGNGEIKYQSKDGIRRFSGGASTLMTLNEDWLFNGQNLGPVVPVDKTKFNLTLMAYHNRQAFISYVDINGTRRRLIWDDSYQRFRNDSIAANSLFVEKDNNFLLYSDTNGNIFQDRVNDFDDGGFSAGIQIKNAIPLNMQLPYMDQKKPKFQKNYQEVTIKLDTQGENVGLSLKFDDGNGPTIVLSAAIACTGMTPFQFKINSGLGQLAYNVSLVVTGSVKKAVTVKELAFKAVIETDRRQAFDSWWVGQGSPEWKLLKQGWFNYTALDAGGITVKIFTDGDLVNAVYTFTLPQTSIRQPLRARFNPIKCRMYRVVATSTSDFMWYDDTVIEGKPLSGNKGYQRSKLA